MTPVVTIRLAGEPNGKGRPRISTRNGMVRAYTPEKTRNYSAALRMAAQVAMGGRSLFDGPVAVIISCSFGIPVSFSRRKQLDALSGVIYPTKKPDIDNIAKHLDALNGVVWTDDKNVVHASIFKHYAHTRNSKSKSEPYENHPPLAKRFEPVLRLALHVRA
jgi:Holliday junction resolvase RusA-like endonuclease